VSGWAQEAKELEAPARFKMDSMNSVFPSTYASQFARKRDARPRLSTA
jgi:hypothetical protein